MDRMRRAFNSALAVPASMGAESPPPHQHSTKTTNTQRQTSDKKHSNHATYLLYTEKLIRVQSSVHHLEIAFETLAESLSGVSEALSPFAAEVCPGELSSAASELLNATHLLSSAVVPAGIDALRAAVLQPLQLLLNIHNEVDSRFLTKDRAVREHDQAVAQLKQVSERHRQAAGGRNSIASRLVGAASRSAMQDEDSAAATRQSAEQAKVVQRVAAAGALATALTAGLDDEVAKLLARRSDVARALLRQTTAVTRAVLEGANSAFCSGGQNDVTPPTQSTDLVTPLATTDDVLSRLRHIIEEADKADWFNVGQERRTAMREQSAHRKQLNRRLRVLNAVERPVRLETYYCLSKAPTGAHAEPIMERPIGVNAANLFMMTPGFFARVAQYLEPSHICTVLSTCTSTLRAVQQQPAEFWWPMIIRWGHLSFSDPRSARMRLVMWEVALGLRGQPGAYWSCAAGQSIPVISHDQFQALHSLALAEAADGGKGSTAPCGDSDELTSARWFSLIEQDVARSYAADAAFGTSILVMRGRAKLLRSRLSSSEEAPLSAGCIGATHSSQQRGAGRRYTEPILVPVVLTTDDLSPSGHEETSTRMSLGTFLAVRSIPLQRQVRDRSQSAAGLSPRKPHTSAVDPILTADTVVQYQRELLDMLLAVAASEPSVRYMQGMNSIGRLALEVSRRGGVQPVDIVRYSTQLLLGLLQSGGSSVTHPQGAKSWRLLSLFYPDTVCLRLRLYQLERLLLRRQPHVHARLAEYGIAVDAFAPSWLLPLFSNFTVLTPAATLRVWDAYIVHGWSALLSVSIAVMETLAPVIMRSSMEQCLAVLSTPRVYLTANPSTEGHWVAVEEDAMESLLHRALGWHISVQDWELFELEKDFGFVPRLV